jgi:hypothetical protein
MNEKEIRFSEHAELKLEILASHDVIIDLDFVIEVVRSPDKLEQADDKLIAQKRLTDELVLRVVYRDFNAFIVIITLYPGKRSRYEKD